MVGYGGAESPFRFTFAHRGPDGGSCLAWFWFPDTRVGNTVVFQYFFTPGDRSTLWQPIPPVLAVLSGRGCGKGDGPLLAERAANNVTAAEGGLESGLLAQGPSVTALSPPAVSDCAVGARPGSLTVGMAAGLGAGTMFLVMGLVTGLLGLLLWRQERERRMKGQLPAYTYTDGATLVKEP